MGLSDVLLHLLKIALKVRSMLGVRAQKKTGRFPDPSQKIDSLRSF